MKISDFYENHPNFKPEPAKNKVLLILDRLTELVEEDVIDTSDFMAYLGQGLVSMENNDFFGTEGMNI